MRTKILYLVCLIATSAMFTTSVTFANPPTNRPALAKEKPAPVKESMRIKGTIKSITPSKNLMKIKGNNGQIYVLPITKNVNGKNPKVGQRINIKITFECCPGKLTIEVKF